MARPRKIVRSKQISVQLPEDVMAKLQLLLYSEVEGRIPHGKQSEFITQVLREAFARGEANVKG